jgi:hypothetical protein
MDTSESSQRRCERLLEAAKELDMPARLLRILSEGGIDESPSPSSSSSSSSSSSPSSPSSFSIICKFCTSDGHEAGARAYFSSPPSGITMCSNRLAGAPEVAEALTHELVHAVDFCRRKWDLGECDALACSEVRAAREAECKYSFWGKERCARRLATVSTTHIFPGCGGECVDRVFDACFQDKTMGESPETDPMRDGRFQWKGPPPKGDPGVGQGVLGVVAGIAGAAGIPSSSFAGGGSLRLRQGLGQRQGQGSGPQGRQSQDQGEGLGEGESSGVGGGDRERNVGGIREEGRTASILVHDPGGVGALGETRGNNSG